MIFAIFLSDFHLPWGFSMVCSILSFLSFTRPKRTLTYLDICQAWSTGTWLMNLGVPLFEIMQPDPKWLMGCFIIVFQIYHMTIHYRYWMWNILNLHRGSRDIENFGISKSLTELQLAELCETASPFMVFPLRQFQSLSPCVFFCFAAPSLSFPHWIRLAK